MLMWCDECKQAVEAIVSRENDFHDEVDTRCYETYEVYRCPLCGEEVYLEPGTCAMCGEPCNPDDELCENCREELEETVGALAEVHGYKNAVAGLTAFVSEVA